MSPGLNEMLKKLGWPKEIVVCLQCGAISTHKSSGWSTLYCVDLRKHGPTTTILVEPVKGQDA